MVVLVLVVLLEVFVLGAIALVLTLIISRKVSTTRSVGAPTRLFSLGSLILFLFTLVVLVYSVFSEFVLHWSIMPPHFSEALIAVFGICFITAVIGFKDVRNLLTALFSWTTVILSLGMVLVIGVFISLSSFFASPSKLLQTIYSPNHTYKIDIYLTNGGATTSYGVIGKMEGPLWFTKTIYSDDKVKNATVNWEGNDTISINGHVLNLAQGQTYFS